MEKEEINYSTYKYALVFRKLLESNKEQKKQNQKQNLKDHLLIDSYDKLSSSSRLRKSTLIDIFWARANPGGSSIDAIINGFGKSFTEFGMIYDSITEKEVNEFKSLIAKKDS
jgi:hypothetical protein